MYYDLNFNKTFYFCNMLASTKISSKSNLFCSGFTANFTLYFDYTYNGKEKDYESGFHYYGSRYYSSEISTWFSTDPMADKYPSPTPYNYCANNPIKLIDPNGEEIVDADGNTMYKDGKWTNYATKEAKK